MKEHISYETAVSLKEKGYPQELKYAGQYFYNEHKVLCPWPNLTNEITVAPSVYTVSCWLEKKGWAIVAHPYMEFGRYYFIIYKKRNNGSIQQFYNSYNDNLIFSYDKIVEEGIKKVLMFL